MYFVQVAHGRWLAYELPYALFKGAVDEPPGAKYSVAWEDRATTLVG